MSDQSASDDEGEKRHTHTDLPDHFVDTVHDEHRAGEHTKDGSYLGCRLCEEEETSVNDPEVVCLCGSTRFKDEYIREQKRLTLEGKIVLTVGLFGHADDVDLLERDKEMLDELHKRKIDRADRVHVIDVNGYVGDSTSSEIKYAERRGIPITWYSEQEGGDPYTCPECGAPGQPFDDGRQAGCHDCGNSWRVIDE